MKCTALEGLQLRNRFPLNNTLPPQQITLKDILRIVIASAVILALATPWLRMLSKQAFLGVIGFASFQTLLSGAILGWAQYRRKRLLDRCGSYIGIGRAGESRNARWQNVSTAYAVMYFLGSQLIGTISGAWVAAMHAGNASSWYYVHYLMPLNFILVPNMFLVMGFRYFRWGLHADSVEFYEHGMGMMDYLTPWQRLEVRRSESNPNNRLAIVIKPTFKNSGKMTTMVWVDPELVEKVLEAATRKQSTAIASPTNPAIDV